MFVRHEFLLLGYVESRPWQNDTSAGLVVVGGTGTGTGGRHGGGVDASEAVVVKEEELTTDTEAPESHCPYHTIDYGGYRQTLYHRSHLVVFDNN